MKRYYPGEYATVTVVTPIRDMTPLELAESRVRWWAGECANVRNVTAYLEALADLDREGKAAGRSYAVDAPEAATSEAISAWYKDQSWRANNGVPRAVRYIGAAYTPEPLTWQKPCGKSEAMLADTPPEVAT